MNRTRLLLVAVVIVLLAIGAWWFFRSGGENVAVDFVTQFPNAVRKQPGPEAFSIIDAKINNETKKAIFTKDLAGTRITYHVTVPDNAWLKVELGLLEDGWKMEGDGVLFSVGVSDGKTYDQLFSLTVNPYGNPADRKWNEL